MAGGRLGAMVDWSHQTSEPGPGLDLELRLDLDLELAPGSQLELKFGRGLELESGRCLDSICRRRHQPDLSLEQTS